MTIQDLKDADVIQQAIDKAKNDPMRPLLVINCITYNHAPYLAQCLEGFVMQKTNFPFVALVHDDASLDGTAEILREYAEKYPDIIKPICDPTNRYSDKSLDLIMNEWINAYEPKYIAMCEGDDYWIDPLKLQKQVDFLDNNPEYGMCFHNVRVVAEDCNLRTDIYGHLQNKDYTVAEFIETWTIPTCSVVYRSYISQHIPHNDKFAVGDNVLFTTCAIYGKIRCINERMGCYRRNGGGWTNGQGLATKFVIHYEAMIEAFPSINRQIFDDQRAEALVSLLFDNIKHLDKHCFSVLIQGVKCYKLRFLYLIVKRIILRIVRCLVHDNKY